ncbi:hypothetical protein PpBr36_03281 [Pyricularia pennisetigena]|uniref:hypothetical protein n=1 Tax=Pyricularia pennisetigena TaxID=1578925 RepID=UPI001151D7B6|nr:hypothetical protein PpBr36_03281 [Pyricularia pennisetigena]TLS30976.1 hypothetical protein PpBr36_03281 [Pyricularia pennisetigena]
MGHSHSSYRDVGSKPQRSENNDGTKVEEDEYFEGIGRLTTWPKSAEQRAECEAHQVREAKRARQQAKRAQKQAEYEAREAERYRDQVKNEAYEAEQKALYEAGFRRFFQAYAAYYEAYQRAFEAFGALKEFEGSDDWPYAGNGSLADTMDDIYDCNEHYIACLRRRWNEVHSD